MKRYLVLLTIGLLLSWSGLAAAQGVIGTIPVPSGGLASPGTLYFSYTTATPTPTPTASPTPVVSANCSSVNTLGSPTIVDASENVWELTGPGTGCQAGNCISLNGQVLTNSWNVIDLTYYDNVIYQENTSDDWYRPGPNGALAGWVGSAAPSCGSTPSPTPTASPTPSPTPTPSATPTPVTSVQPLGNPPLPPGTTKWVLTYDDEFNTDSSLNHSLWNGTAGYPSGYNNPYCNPSGDNDAIGPDAGDCAEYYGTVGTAPYAGLVPGVGAEIQQSATDWSALTNVDLPNGNQTYGIWEVMAQQPHDNSGEGDGMHPDIWLTSPARQSFSNGMTPCQDEVDIAENELGANGTARDSVNVAIWDGTSSGPPTLNGGYSYPGNAGDLSAGFHAYAMQWAPPGANSSTGAAGSFQAFFDGVAQHAPIGVNDSCWTQYGAYLLLWSQDASTAFFNGTGVDSNTTNNDPLIIKYVRVWQAEGGATPTPTVSPTATPTASPSPSPTATPTPTNIAAGEYAICNAPTGQCIDAGFNPGNLEVYADNYQNAGTNQLWNVTASGSGDKICNTVQPTWCLASNSSNYLLSSSQADVFSIVADGSNWSVKDQSNGEYMNPLPTANAGVVTTSSSPQQIDFIPITSTPTPTPSGSPTATPSATPTPVNGSANTVDPNAIPQTKAELAWLQSLTTIGNAHHLIQGGVQVIRSCVNTGGNIGCAQMTSANYAGNGNQYYGMDGEDPANAAWGDKTTSPCSFGSGSDWYTMIMAAHSRGEIIMTEPNYPNPATNPNCESANAIGETSGTPCPGGGADSNDPGASYDCGGGMNESYAEQMVTPGTTQYNNWLHEMSLYVPDLLAFQAQGITIIWDSFGELDGTALWWGPGLQGGTQIALKKLEESYFESQGVHNLLYDYTTISPDTNGYPGNQYIDLTGWDGYPPYVGGVDPHYSALVGFDKPMVMPEWTGQPSQTCSYMSTAETYMPDFVAMRWFRGQNPGSQKDDAGSWSACVNSVNFPYDIMQPNVPGF